MSEVASGSIALTDSVYPKTAGTASGAIGQAIWAGFDPAYLLPVLPPNLEPGVDTGPEFKVGNLGKTPATYDQNAGLWRARKGWDQGVPQAELHICDLHGANAGLRLGVGPVDSPVYVFADFDTEPGNDPESRSYQVAKWICRISLKTITQAVGPVWVRETRPGRMGVLFMLKAGQHAGTKAIIHLSHKEEVLGKIEVLARGQQVVIGGMHPHGGGTPIQWWRSDQPGVFQPAPDMTLEDFKPLKSRAVFDSIMLNVLATLERVHLTCTAKTPLQSTLLTSLLPLSPEEQAAPSTARLVELLDQTPHGSDIDYDSYVNYMKAISGTMHAMRTLGRLQGTDEEDIGYAAARWAGRWKDPNGVGADEADMQAKWESDFSKSPAERIGWSYLEGFAVKAGVRSVRQRQAQEAFVADLEPVAATGPGPSSPIQVVAGELHLAATAAEEAILGSRLPVFQRDRALVRPISREVPASRGRTTIAAGLGVVELHGMVDILSGCARFEKYDARAKNLVRINPPSSVVQIMLSRYGGWRVPPVAGVITTPSLRPDGSVLSEPGYDAATRLYHVPDPGLTLTPEVVRPTRQAAENAIKLLDALLIEFPFTTSVARAVALSAIITPVIGGALSVKPLHMFRANIAGSGKSYLVDIVSAISAGRPCPVVSVAPDEAETEKRLTGLLLAGYPLVSLDNVNGELGGDLLCQAVERPFIRLRRLGASDIIEIESCVTILATGNNARVRGDMVRRTLMCDLDPRLERPELREFNGSPVVTIAADRSRFVSACLTIVRAYLEAGKPNLPKPLASYEDWSCLVRGALIWLGYADPVESMEAAREDDPDLAELRGMVQAWRSTFGTEAMTCRGAIDAALKCHSDEGLSSMEHLHPELYDVLLRVAGNRGEPDSTRLGTWLGKFKGKISAGLRFVRLDGTIGGVARWKLEAIGGLE